MYWVEVIKGPDKGKKVKLKTESSILIGRELSVFDLNLQDVGVSRCHARLTLKADGEIILRDEGSTNGIYLRGKKVSEEIILLPEEYFQVGQTSIRLTKMLPGLQPEEGAKLSGHTYLVHEGSYYISATAHEQLISIKEKEKVIKIGRDTSNDIVLEHPLVSRFHATIMTFNGDYIICDLNSTNGTYVNGLRVDRKTTLPPNSLVQICGYRLFFDGKKIVEYDENRGNLLLEINNLSKIVIDPSGNPLKIMDNISMAIEPSEFVAILGGSGAGKSTLLGALTGMRPATSGNIWVNGRDFYKEYNVFRSMIGYVPQDNIVHTNLTVYEVFSYSARLRMPPDTDDQEIEAVVKEVMDNLELSHRRDNLVSELSGGQQKRVSIGVELLTKPSMFFLDEPTSGLDPGLEKMMMEMLRRLADQGRTIILVTHATFNISLCDKVIFLTEGGKLAFCGTPSEALNYFNTSDYAEIYKKIATEKNPAKWAEEYTLSDVARRQAMINETHFDDNSEARNRMERNFKPKYSAIYQWLILTSRYWKILRRDRKNVALLLLQPIVIAALIVMTFYHSSPTYEFSEYDSEKLSITDQVISEGRIEDVLDLNEKENTRQANMTISVAIMVISAIWLGTSNAAREIVKELAIYRRERFVNLQIGSYLFSKIAVLFLVSSIQAAIFVFILKVGLNMPEYWLNTLAFLLISQASVMMGLTISAIASDTNTAISAVPLLLVPQIILSGALLPAEKVQPEFMQNIFYLAVSKWGYELVGGAILDINNRVALEEPVKALSGDLSNHWFVLLGIVIILLIISALALRRKDISLD